MSFIAKHQLGSIILNIFAITVTLLPVASLGYWGYKTFSPDPRQVASLSQITTQDNPRLFEEPLVTVTFDDGWESAYSVAGPIMSQYNIASTQYILPSQFTSPNYMSVAQAKSMKEAGHEITSHTYTHPNLTHISQGEVVKELDLSLQVLKKLKLSDNDKLNFAPPNGAVNEQAIAEIKTRFFSSRNVNGDLANDVSSNDINVKGSFNRYNIIGYSVGEYTTDEQFKQALEFAKRRNAWFVPVYHQVDSSADPYSVSPETFERHMRLIHESGIKTATMRQVLTRLGDNS